MKNSFLFFLGFASLCIISCETDDDHHDEECHECHVLCAMDDGSTHEHEIELSELSNIGLPIALKFSKKIKTFGYDNNISRIGELKKGYDANNEFKKKDIIENKNLSFTFSEKVISNADYIIVTVPTPINRYKKPDFNPLNSACKSICKNLKKK